jgi:hypothetical protein
MTKEAATRARGKGDAVFDYALPQNWIDEVYQLTGIYPAPYFVWLYEGSIWGRPYPISEAGKELLANYANRLAERETHQSVR